MILRLKNYLQDSNLENKEVIEVQRLLSLLVGNAPFKNHSFKEIRRSTCAETEISKDEILQGATKELTLSRANAVCINFEKKIVKKLYQLSFEVSISLKINLKIL